MNSVTTTTIIQSWKMIIRINRKIFDVLYSRNFNKGITKLIKLKTLKIIFFKIIIFNEIICYS